MASSNSFWRVWVKRPELYPLYAALGAGAALATYYPLRLLALQPDIYVTARDKRSDPMDPESERWRSLAEKNEHRIRHWKSQPSSTGLASYLPMKYDVPEYEQKKRDAFARGEEV